MISTFEIRAGELRATFLRNHNMRRHKRLQRHHTGPQAEDNSSLEEPHNPDSRQNRQQHEGATPDQGRYTRSGALHPIRGATPVTWRCTRYVAVHPNRRGALPTDRVQRPNKQEQTRNWHTEPLTAAPLHAQLGETQDVGTAETTAAPLHAQLGPTGSRMGTPPTPPPALRPTPTPPAPSHAKSRLTIQLGLTVG